MPLFDIRACGLRPRHLAERSTRPAEQPSVVGGMTSSGIQIAEATATKARLNSVRTEGKRVQFSVAAPTENSVETVRCQKGNGDPKATVD